MHEWMIEWTKNWINEINEMRVVKNIEEKQTEVEDLLP